MIRIGINGLGRIGRHVFKGIKENYSDMMQVVAVNDLAELKTCVHLIKHDSIYGEWNHEIGCSNDDILLDSVKIKKFSCRTPGEIDWQSRDVDIVIESTGRFRTSETASGHLSGCVKKVIITAPAKGEDITIVPGINMDDYDAEKHQIVSCASCTTNCVAQIIKHIDDNFGIKSCSFITVHAYSNDQSIIDQPHADLRRARALAVNTIPTTTGASAAVVQVLPRLNGKISSAAYRVPVECGSLVDCTFYLEKDADAKQINDAFRKAANSENGKYVNITEEELVSADFRQNTHSCIVDGDLTDFSNGIARVVGWYDNEWSYSMRVCDLTAHIAKQL